MGYFRARPIVEPSIACAERLPDKKACRLMVDLLALIYQRRYEAELAAQFAPDLDGGQRPASGD